MKKTIALLLTLVMVFGLAASFPAYADDEIVINFPSIWVGTDSKAACMAKLVEDFNAENAGSIKVVVEEQTDYQAYRDKIRTTITTGSAPDVCILATTFDIKAYAESGKFMDPRIFNEIGWDHFPATYDEFFQFCKDAKAAGLNAMGQMAGDNAWSSMLWYSLLVEAIGGKDVYADGLDNPAFVKAAEALKEMYAYTFDGAVSATAGDVNGHFLSRDTVVYLNGPWWIANFYKEDNAVDGVLLADDCEVAVNPSFEGGLGDKGLVTTVQGFLAPAKQDDPAKEAAVVKFLQYITDPAHVSELALSSGAMFFVKYTPSPDTSVISQKVTEVANNAAYTILHVNGAFPTAFSTEFPAAVSSLILDQVDAQGFVDMLKDAIDE